MVIIADDGIDLFRRSLNSDGFGNMKGGHGCWDLNNENKKRKDYSKIVEVGFTPARMVDGNNRRNKTPCTSPRNSIACSFLIDII